MGRSVKADLKYLKAGKKPKKFAKMSKENDPQKNFDQHLASLFHQTILEGDRRFSISMTFEPKVITNFLHRLNNFHYNFISQIYVSKTSEDYQLFPV